MYLVTGGAGFIGSNIAEALLEKGEKVRILDNFSTGRIENIQKLIKDIELVRGDLRDLDTVRAAVKGAKYVLHYGALPSVPVSVEDPIGTNESNITGTLNIIVAAKECAVHRVVYASTCAVYGNDLTLPKEESMATDPRSPYALQKLAGEYYCRQFSELYGLSTVSLRYFNVFGKRQYPASPYSAVIPRFLEAIFNHKRPVIYGDGEQTRDFVFIDDVINANLLAINAKHVKGAVINIASGERISINDLVKNMSDVLEREIDPDYKEPREGDIRHSVADVSEAVKKLGFKAKVPFNEGMKKYVSWFEKYGRR